MIEGLGGVRAGHVTARETDIDGRTLVLVVAKGGIVWWDGFGKGGGPSGVVVVVIARGVVGVVGVEGEGGVVCEVGKGGGGEHGGPVVVWEGMHCRDLGEKRSATV